jgi:hypothetical protein
MKTDPATPAIAAEFMEGTDAFRQFDEGVKQILSVPHSLLVRRERAYKKKAAANPKRRGPKPKQKN